jgi:type II secretory ATPase GspE/PulE/Tfp pilus assembly ATPase PilB-like protein
MEVEPYLIATSLLAVLAQRLVRVVCPNCKVEATPEQAKAWRLGPAAKTLSTAFVGKGCTLCNSTGYRGRTGVFELLEVTPRLTELIARRAEPDALRAQARADGMKPMLEDGVNKVAEGITTVDEIVRVIHSVE